MSSSPTTCATTANSGATTATKSPKPPSPPCATIKKLPPRCAAALAALILGRSVNISQIEDLLNNADNEKEFLSSLKARKNEFSGCLNTAAELPSWLIARLQQHYTDEQILAFGRSVAQPAPLDVRVNTLNSKRDKALAQLQTEYPQAIATPYAPHGIRFPNKPALNQHPLFLDGTIEVQDEGSQLLAQLVNAKRGEIIVDFCAGAGGKTLAIGAQMANKGRIYAFDVSEKRLANLKPRMTRAGLTNIHPEKIHSETDLRIARLAGKANRVLVDAPCSGLGTLRRNPDLKYRQSPDTLASLQTQQQNILHAAAELMRAGGQSRPQIPPIARNPSQFASPTAKHLARRRRTRARRRAAGLRHLQHPARRKRKPSRTLLANPPRL